MAVRVGSDWLSSGGKQRKRFLTKRRLLSRFLLKMVVLSWQSSYSEWLLGLHILQVYNQWGWGIVTRLNMNTHNCRIMQKNDDSAVHYWLWWTVLLDNPPVITCCGQSQSTLNTTVFYFCVLFSLSIFSLFSGTHIGGVDLYLSIVIML